MLKLILKTEDKKLIKYYLVFLINREDVPAKESPLAACTFIEGIVIFPIRRPIRIVDWVIANTSWGASNVKQVVLLMKVSTNCQINKTQEHR